MSTNMYRFKDSAVLCAAGRRFIRNHRQIFETDIDDDPDYKDSFLESLDLFGGREFSFEGCFALIYVCLCDTNIDTLCYEGGKEAYKDAGEMRKQLFASLVNALVPDNPMLVASCLAQYGDGSGARDRAKRIVDTLLAEEGQTDLLLELMGISAGVRQETDAIVSVT